MLPSFAVGSPLWEAVSGLIILAIAFVIAFLVQPFLTRIARVLTARTKTALDDLLVEAINRPIFLYIIVLGIYLALITTTYLDKWQSDINKGWLISTIVIAFYAIQRITSAFVKWYGLEISAKRKGRLDDSFLSLIRRFLTATIYAIGIIVILDNFGIRVSAVIAGLGLGGLAVALALQPTLTNFIASAYVVADGSIGPGDFIEVMGGPSGTVTDIGWRTTKILTPIGNIVLIPNSKLADSIVTNFHAPTPEINIFLSCGVSYESDLERVEAVAKEVGEQVIQELPDSVVVKDFKPSVVFRDFGDSNINFILIVKAKDRPGTFAVTHTLVKRLHARFGKEGIEINYPVRKVIYAQQDGSKGTPRANG